jgi:hypothetical protein
MLDVDRSTRESTTPPEVVTESLRYQSSRPDSDDGEKSPDGLLGPRRP